jgi:hypothetical protein
MAANMSIFPLRFSGLGSLKVVDGSKDIIGAKSQADINIFTVASGLLYEAGFGGSHS